MSTGRERFVASLNMLRADRIPETARKWDALPEGYRAMIHKQAAVPVKPYAELDAIERQKLYQANQRVLELAAKAQGVLISGVIAK